MPGFLPGGLIQTAAQAFAIGGARRNSTGRRRRKRVRAGSSAGRRKRAKKSAGGRRTRKPKPGTKAWMAYIRKKRKRK